MTKLENRNKQPNKDEEQLVSNEAKKGVESREDAPIN